MICEDFRSLTESLALRDYSSRAERMAGLIHAQCCTACAEWLDAFVNDLEYRKGKPSKERIRQTISLLVADLTAGDSEAL